MVTVHGQPIIELKCQAAVAFELADVSREIRYATCGILLSSEADQHAALLP